MKQILIHILLLVFPLISFAQVSESFGGRFIVTSQTSPLPASDMFRVVGIFKHPRANYTADSIQVGDIFVDCNCNYFTVDSIYSTVSNLADIRVMPADTTVNLIPSCTGGVIRINSPPNGTYTFPANIPLEIMDCFLNYNFQALSGQALSGLDTAYLANDTLYLVTPSDTLRIYIPTPYLNTLPDVDTANISNGDFLMWDSIAGNWIPQEILPDYLNNLPDVDTANIDIDDILQWDGSDWIMTSPVELIGDGGGAYGSGLAGRTAYWLDDSTLVHTEITYSSTILDASALTGALRLPSGTDAQDPIWAAGMLRYNTTAGGFQGYNTVERYLPWADADNFSSGRIPYSDGGQLTSSANLAYVSDDLYLGGTTDNGFYFGLQINSDKGIYAKGQSLFSSGRTNSYTLQVDNASNTTEARSLDVQGNGAACVVLRHDSHTGLPLYIGLNQNIPGTSIFDAIEIGSRPHAGSATPNYMHTFTGTGTGRSIRWGYAQQGNASGCRGGSLLSYTAALFTPKVYESNCDTIYVDIDQSARHGTTLAVVHRVRKGQLIMPFYGSGNFTGTPEKSISVTSSGAFVEVPEKWGVISTSTDGSGDIVVAHGMVVTPTVVDIQFTGTSGSATPYVYVVLTDGTDATNFTIRVFDMTGAAVASTAVTATWHCKT